MRDKSETPLPYTFLARIQEGRCTLDAMMEKGTTSLFQSPSLYNRHTDAGHTLVRRIFVLATEISPISSLASVVILARSQLYIAE